MAVGVKENATSAAVWMRGLYIIIFGVILYFVFGLVWLLVIFQFLTKLFTGGLNQQLRRFAAPLSRYVSQILNYITFQSDERPFPFSPWPADEPPAKPPAQGGDAASGQEENASRQAGRPPATAPGTSRRTSSARGMSELIDLSQPVVKHRFGAVVPGVV